MKYQLVLKIPTEIPDLTYRNFGLQSSSPATGEKGIFLEKLLWNLYLFCAWLHLLLEHRPGITLRGHISELQRAHSFRLSGEQ